MTGAVEDGQLTLPQLVWLSVVGIERSDTHQVGVQLQKKIVVSKRGGQSYGHVWQRSCLQTALLLRKNKA